MESSKGMIDIALKRMVGFTLERSSYGDNRSIFGMVKMLIQSASGETWAEYRKPLEAVLKLRARDHRDKFYGVKLMLLQDTIRALFCNHNKQLSEKDFAEHDRNWIFEYLEVCRRIFMTKYAPVLQHKEKNQKSKEPVYETVMQHKILMELDKKSRKAKGGEK